MLPILDTAKKRESAVADDEERVAHLNSGATTGNCYRVDALKSGTPFETPSTQRLADGGDLKLSRATDWRQETISRCGPLDGRWRAESARPHQDSSGAALAPTCRDTAGRRHVYSLAQGGLSTATGCSRPGHLRSLSPCANFNGRPQFLVLRRGVLFNQVDAMLRPKTVHADWRHSTPRLESKLQTSNRSPGHHRCRHQPRKSLKGGTAKIVRYAAVSAHGWPQWFAHPPCILNASAVRYDFYPTSNRGLPKELEAALWFLIPAGRQGTVQRRMRESRTGGL